MHTVYLFPCRELGNIYTRPDLLPQYAELTGFTGSEILEKSEEAIQRGRTPVFEADITDKQLDGLKSLYCEIPWQLKEDADG